MACLKCEPLAAGGLSCPECETDYCEYHYNISVKTEGTYDKGNGLYCSTCGAAY